MVLDAFAAVAGPLLFGAAALWYLRRAYLFRRRQAPRQEQTFLNEYLSVPIRALPLVNHFLGILAGLISLAFLFPSVLLPVIQADGSIPPLSYVTTAGVIYLLGLLYIRVFGRRALEHAPVWLKEKLEEQREVRGGPE